jgi:hypothetical protein
VTNAFIIQSNVIPQQTFRVSAQWGNWELQKTKAKILPNQAKNMELDYARET